MCAEYQLMTVNLDFGLQYLVVYIRAFPTVLICYLKSFYCFMATTQASAIWLYGFQSLAAFCDQLCWKDQGSIPFERCIRSLAIWFVSRFQSHLHFLGLTKASYVLVEHPSLVHKTMTFRVGEEQMG